MYNGPLPVIVPSSKFMGQSSNICTKELQKPLRACGSNYNQTKILKTKHTPPQPKTTSTIRTKYPKPTPNNNNKKNNPKPPHPKKIVFPHNRKQYFK